MRLYNYFVRWLLRSRWHALMSKSNMLITFAGRKSRQTYSVPVNYLRDNGLVYTISFRNRTWWRNLRGGTAVTLRLQGRDVPANAEALTEPVVVEQGLRDCIRIAPSSARLYRITLDSHGEPNRDELTRAAQTYVVIRIRFA